MSNAQIQALLSEMPTSRELSTVAIDRLTEDNDFRDSIRELINEMKQAAAHGEFELITCVDVSYWPLVSMFFQMNGYSWEELDSNDAEDYGLDLEDGHIGFIVRWNALDCTVRMVGN